MNRCPHCNLPLTSDEQKAGNCPGCGQALSTAFSAAPLEREIRREFPTPREETYPEREFDPGRGDPLLGWASIRTSFTIFASGWIVVQLSMLFLLLVEGGLRNVRGNPPGGVLTLMTVFSLAVIVGVVHFLTGMCMAVAVPGEASAKGWGIGIIFSLVLSLVALLILIGSAGDPGMIRGVSYLYLGGLFLAKLLYTGFVQGVARHYRLRGLALATLVYLACELALFAWVFVRTFHGPFRRLGGPLDDIFGGPGSTEGRWLMIVISTGMCAWFVTTVLVVRATVTRSLIRRS